MDLLLGVFAKRGSVPMDGWDAALSDFSLEGRRQTRVMRFRSAILAVVTGLTCDVTADRASGRTAIVSGPIFELNSGSSAASALLQAHDARSKHGIPFSFSGVYGFAIYDDVRDELIVGCDELGLYPIFLYDSPNLFAFCTEYEPLTRLPGFDSSIDDIAVIEYFSLGSTQGNRTFFKSISRQAPGTITTVNGECVKSVQVATLDVAIDYSASIEDHADRVYGALQDATRRLAHMNPPLACSLTGGVDTRLIVGILQQEGNHSRHFFTRQRLGSEVLDDADLLIARLLALHFGLKHETQLRREQKPKPFTPASFAARREVEASRTLGGLHGGEILGGSCVKKFSPLRPGAVDCSSVLRLEYRRRFADPKTDFERQAHADATNREMFLVIQNMTRAFFANFYGGSPTDWLTPYRLPLISMSPFWSPDLIRAVLAVPYALISEYRLYRTIYDRHHADLLFLPFETTAAAFPRLRVRRVTPMDGTSYAVAIGTLLESPDPWALETYDFEYLRSLALHEEDATVHMVADFQMWREVFARTV